MPAVTRTPRIAWIEAGLHAIGVGGVPAVRVEALAEHLGVTKGSFYGWFADRPAFLDAVLDEWERRSTDEVIDLVESEGGDPRAKIRRAGTLTFSADLMPVDLAVRDWARRDPAVSARLRRVDNRRMDYLRTLFSTFVSDPDDVEARSTLAFTLLIGDHFMAADHDGRTRSEALGLAGRFLTADRQAPPARRQRR